MTKIEYDVAAMLKGGGRLDALGGELSGLSGAVAAVSLDGVPPAMAGAMKGKLTHITGDLKTASSECVGQGEAVLRMAGQALAADAGGPGAAPLPAGTKIRGLGKIKGKDGKDIDLRKFLNDLRSAPNPLDVPSMLNTAREEGRKWLEGANAGLKATRRKLKYAKQFYKDNAWVRRIYKSPEKLMKDGKKLGVTVRRLDKATRVLDKLDPIEHLPAGLRNNPIARRAPVLGGLLDFGANVASGRSVEDSAAKAVVTSAAGAAGAGVGGVACGTAAAATLGLGAATCPVLTTGGAVAFSWVADKAYDPIIKPVGEKAIHVTGDVVHFVTHPHLP